MVYNKIESRGAMFPRQKKTQKSPDMTGDFVLQGEALDYVAAELQRGSGEVKLYLSAWRQTGNSGPFNSFVIRPPMEYSDPNSQRQQYGNQRPQGYTPQRPQPPQQVNSYQQARGGGPSNRVGNNAAVNPEQGYRQDGGRRLHPSNPGSGGGGHGSLSFPGDDEAPF